MKREHLLTYLRVAGYHNDAAAYTRLLIENRISMKAAKAAFAAGSKARESGVPCDCRTCKIERARAGASARQAAMCANFGFPPAREGAKGPRVAGPVATEQPFFPNREI